MTNSFFRKVRYLIQNIPKNVPKDLALLSIAFAIIFCAFAIKDIQDYRDMPPSSLLDGAETVYGFYDKRVLLPAIQRYRKDNGKPVSGYSIPSASLIGLDLQKVSTVNDEQAFASASGVLTLAWDEESIQDYENVTNKLEQNAKSDLMSALSLNFYSEEEKLLKLLWRNSYNNSEGVKSFRENYFFRGNFKIDHDFRKFPFDVSTLNIRVSTPIQAPDIMLVSDLEITDNSDPQWRINSYLYDKQDCKYSKDWKLEQGLYKPQWICATDILDNVSDKQLLEDFKEGKSLPYSEVENLFSSNPGIIYTTKLRRALGSSFYRYIAPIAFVMLVASIFDQLDDDAWEVKIAIPPTILLTLIFMHSAFRAEIPQISYITFMDRIYFLAYASCILLLLSTILSRRAKSNISRENPAAGDLVDTRRLQQESSRRLVIAIRGMFIFLVTMAPLIVYYYS